MFSATTNFQLLSNDSILFISFCTKKKIPKTIALPKLETNATVTTTAINTVTPSKSRTITASTTNPMSTTQITKSSLPPLKQKTGIVKSKVPPPVPPRGSPRDRRESAGSNKTIASARGASPLSGELNYLNDKYFDCVRPNTNNLCKLTPNRLHPNRSPQSKCASPQPIFGDRRSPTNVRDWLEVNDFHASDFDEIILRERQSQSPTNVTIKPKIPISIKTSLLQRENSFRSSGSSVLTMVKDYSKKIQQRKLPMRTNIIRDIYSINGLDICTNSDESIPKARVRAIKSSLEIHKSHENDR